MSLARVQFFSVSLDGFGTGEGQSLETPFGHAGERLHEWMFVTRWWRQMVGEPGGSSGIDDAFLRQHDTGIGAEIMGAGKFGPPGWHENPEWKGWWGPNPPFHTPVFVLTHHPRPSIEMEGGTTFHFLDASPAEALKTAREAAAGQDVRIGGGVSIIRDFVAARLIDHMHIAVVPILLGRGERLWDGLDGLETDYEIEAISSPSGVTHVTFSPCGWLIAAVFEPQVRAGTAASQASSLRPVDSLRTLNASSESSLGSPGVPLWSISSSNRNWPGLRAMDRRRSRQIGLSALAIGVVVGMVAVLLPV